MTIDPKTAKGSDLPRRVAAGLTAETPRKPGRGVIALCSRGYPGIITEDEPRKVTYPDGNEGVAWVGVNLSTGKPWSSRTPRVVGTLADLLSEVRGLGRAFLRRSGGCPCRVRS